jgi:hypothetical protein
MLLLGSTPKVTSSNWDELTTSMLGGGCCNPISYHFNVASRYHSEKEENMDHNFESSGGGNLFMFVLCGLLCR